MLEADSHGFPLNLVAKVASPYPQVSVPSRGSLEFIRIELTHYAQKLIVVPFFFRLLFFVLKFSFSSFFIVFGGFEDSDLPKQLREVISCNSALFRSKSDDLGSKNDEKTVLRKNAGHDY